MASFVRKPSLAIAAKTRLFFEDQVVFGYPPGSEVIRKFFEDFSSVSIDPHAFSTAYNREFAQFNNLEPDKKNKRRLSKLAKVVPGFVHVSEFHRFTKWSSARMKPYRRVVEHYIDKQLALDPRITRLLHGFDTHSEIFSRKSFHLLASDFPHQLGYPVYGNFLKLVGARSPDESVQKLVQLAQRSCSYVLTKSPFSVDKTGLPKDVSTIASFFRKIESAVEDPSVAYDNYVVYHTPQLSATLFEVHKQFPNTKLVMVRSLGPTEEDAQHEPPDSEGDYVVLDNLDQLQQFVDSV